MSVDTDTPGCMRRVVVLGLTLLAAHLHGCTPLEVPKSSFHVSKASVSAFGHESKVSIMSNVVLVHTKFGVYSRVMPWQMRSQTFQHAITGVGSARASGIILTRGQILTAAFIAVDQVVTTASRKGDNTEYEARVVSVARDLGLAILSVDDPAFWKIPFQTIEPENGAKLLRIGTKIVAAGFDSAHQSDSLSQVSAEVAGVDSDLSGSTGRYGIPPRPMMLLHPKIGNKVGVGPVFRANDMTLVGFLSLTDTVIPLRVIADLVRAIKKFGRWPGLSMFGAVTRNMQTPAIREYWDMPADSNGVQVRAVSPDSPMFNKVERGDMILAIDGKPISSDGTIIYDGAEDSKEHTVTVHFEMRIGQKVAGGADDVTTLKIRRPVPKNTSDPFGKLGYGKSREFDVDINFGVLTPLAEEEDDSIAAPTEPIQKPSYFLLGGLVWTVLTDELLSQNAYFREKGNGVDVPASAEVIALHQWRNDPDEEVIILLRGLSSRCHDFYATDEVRVLRLFNDKPVKNMSLFVSMVGDALQAKAPFLTFAFAALSDRDEQGGIGDPDIVLNTTLCRGSDMDVMKRFHVPAPVSKDLMPEFKKLIEPTGWLGEQHIKPSSLLSRQESALCDESNASLDASAASSSSFAQKAETVDVEKGDLEEELEEVTDSDLPLEIDVDKVFMDEVVGDAAAVSARDVKGDAKADNVDEKVDELEVDGTGTDEGTDDRSAAAVMQEMSEEKVDEVEEVDMPGAASQNFPHMLGAKQPPSKSSAPVKAAPANAGPVPAIGKAVTEADMKKLPVQNVVKIHLVSSDQDFLVPWRMGSEGFGICSAIIVSVKERRIMTNSHCVAGSQTLFISREELPDRSVAKVVELGRDVDLAWITTDSPSFWASKDLEPEVPLTFGLPFVSSPISVVGYPMGGNGLTITQGSVSSIDGQIYPNKMRRSWRNTPDLLLVMLVDAAINPGNSGGPCFDNNGNLLGLAFAGLQGAQSVGYVIPVVHLRNFVDAKSRHGRWVAQPELGARWRKIQNAGMRGFLHMKDNETGVQLRTVAPLSPIFGKMKKGDVLLSVDDHPVLSNSKVHYNITHGNKTVRIMLPFGVLITAKAVGEKTVFQVLRVNSTTSKRERLSVSVILKPVPPLVPRFDDRPTKYKGRETFSARPTYFMLFGLVWGVFSNPLLLQAAKHKQQLPWSLMRSALHNWRSSMDEEVVVLVNGLPHSCNLYYDLKMMRRLKEFNGHPVRNLSQLVQFAGQAMKDQEEYMRFTFDPLADRDIGGGCLSDRDVTDPLVSSAAGCKGGEADPDFVFKLSTCRDTDTDLLEQHNIPSPVSEDLQEVYAKYFPKQKSSVMPKEVAQLLASVKTPSASATQSASRAVQATQPRPPAKSMPEKTSGVPSKPKPRPEPKPNDAASTHPKTGPAGAFVEVAMRNRPRSKQPRQELITPGVNGVGQ
eukprot:TRINITY_DN25137_c0_g1_i1.p1 TRINITY_DN25137_c0_g1~~TRINITY_DN25137_c0_g1_i1.p1  ORF type:complete len:1435 (-),score=300.45 TRINITY_DN25137_c0_g1_i1:168-4472(-)